MNYDNIIIILCGGYSLSVKSERIKGLIHVASRDD